MPGDYKAVFKDNLQKYLKARHKRQVDLAQYLGINPATVSAWCHGTRFPRMEALEKIADFLGVTPAELLTAPEEEAVTRIPVLGNVAGGVPIEEIENIEDYVYVPRRLTYGSTLFALRIKGHSMEPDIKDGDVVVVRWQPTIENSEIAIVSVDGGYGTCKIFKKTDEGIWLISKNPAYAPMFIPREEADGRQIQNLGKVIQVIRNV